MYKIIKNNVYLKFSIYYKYFDNLVTILNLVNLYASSYKQVRYKQNFLIHFKQYFNKIISFIKYWYKINKFNIIIYRSNFTKHINNHEI